MPKRAHPLPDSRRGAEVSVDHVVWDWNGTLLDDLPVVHEAVNDALESVGGPRLTRPEYMGVFARPLSVFYRRIMGRDLTAGEWRLAAGQFDKSYHDNIHKISLDPQAMESLEAVSSAGISQSILSLYPHERLVSLVEDMGIRHFFTRIDGLVGEPGRSKVGSFGPHLRSAAPGVAPDRAVMIGDTIDDLAAARSGGSNGLLVDHHGWLRGDPEVIDSYAECLLGALGLIGLVRL